MKSRTFIVLFTENYEDRDITDQQAVTELRDYLTVAYEEGDLNGNFLITHVEDGNEMFWREWKALQ